MSSTTGSAPRVTLLGADLLGAAVARRIAAAGMPLTVWEEPADLAAAVASADVVVSLLPDAQAVLEALEGAGEHLGADAVWLQASAVGVEGSDWVVDCAVQTGVRLVDAPVLGSVAQAEQGGLTVLAASDPVLRDAVAPVLDAIGRRTLWLGDAPGAGSRLKVAVDVWALTLVQGVADSMALARELGVDPGAFLEAVEGSSVDSTCLQEVGRRMLAGDFDPSLTLGAALRDADLALAAAMEAGVELAALPGIRRHLQRAVDAGHGGDDVSATWTAH